MTTIQSIQSISAPWLDTLATAVSMLGTEEFFMLAIPFIYLCVDKRLGMALGTIFLCSSFMNAWTKNVFALPRPFAMAAPGEIRVLAQESATGYSFPSGNVQGATVFWGYWATRCRKAWFVLLAAIIVLLVAFSRIYMGLHFFIDLLGGLTFGLAVLIVFRWLEGKAAGARLGLGMRLAAAALPLLALALYAGQDAIKVIGFLSGLLFGFNLESHLFGFNAKAPLGKQIVKAVLGIGGLFALQLLTRALFPDGFWQLLRYGLLALWVTVAAPYLFVSLRLATRDNARILL